MSTPCLYDTCESLTPWSWTSKLTPSIDSIIKKEGTGSIKVLINDPSGGPANRLYRDFAQCDLYFGIWIRHTIIQLGQSCTLQLRKIDGAYAQIGFGWNQYTNQPSWGSAVRSATGSGTGYDHGLFSANEWAWFEIYIDAAANTSFRRGGVGIQSYSGWLTYPSAYLNLDFACYYQTMAVNLDYIKWGPGWDYPPVPPSLKLHPFWRLKPP